MMPILTYLSSPMVLCCQKQAGSLGNPVLIPGFLSSSLPPHPLLSCGIHSQPTIREQAPSKGVI